MNSLILFLKKSWQPCARNPYKHEVDSFLVRKKTKTITVAIVDMSTHPQTKPKITKNTTTKKNGIYPALRNPIQVLPLSAWPQSARLQQSVCACVSWIRCLSSTHAARQLSALAPSQTHFLICHSTRTSTTPTKSYTQQHCKCVKEASASNASHCRMAPPRTAP